jgi:hypothetical protein
MIQHAKTLDLFNSPVGSFTNLPKNAISDKILFLLFLSDYCSEPEVSKQLYYVFIRSDLNVFSQNHKKFFPISQC